MATVGFGLSPYLPSWGNSKSLGTLHIILTVGGVWCLCRRHPDTPVLEAACPLGHDLPPHQGPQRDTLQFPCLDPSFPGCGLLSVISAWLLWKGQLLGKPSGCAITSCFV